MPAIGFIFYRALFLLRVNSVLLDEQELPRAYLTHRDEILAA